MSTRSLLAASAAVLIAVAPAFAQAPAVDREPILRLDAGGATAYVTALAFSPDGKRLYAAGWDKVVRVWVLGDKGQFVLDKASYRVPLGPGDLGAVNAIALSPDGDWLAVAGDGLFTGSSGFREAGVMWLTTSMTADMLRDSGTIYLFHTRKPGVRRLRGHLGWVRSLAFAPAHANKPPLLVSVAQEMDPKTKKRLGKAKVWDVAKGATADDGVALPDLESRLPSVSVWHTGNELKQLGVALACGDRILRVWDVARTEERVRQVKEALYLTAAYLPDRERLLTAGSGEDQAVLKLWDVAAEPRTEARPGPSRFNALPRALTLFASQGDNKLDHAAVVVRVPDGDKSYLLQVVGVGAEGFGTMKANFRLWNGTNKQPVLAAAPRGGHVAVAGNDGHSVYVYRVQDLLQERNEPQRLRSVGTTFRGVAFVTDGNNLGLSLSESAKARPGQPARAPQEGDLTFDFARRRLTGDRDGWKPSGPAADGWRAELTGEQKRPVLTVSQGDRSAARVELKGLLPNTTYVVTDYALLPPRPPLNVPVVALAFLENGQPILRLYNGATGEPLRQCNGHEGRIDALAFSADGRLLASAADDQTVAVWSLTNLDQHVGKRGRIHGLTVRVRDNALVVNQVQGGAAQGKVNVGEPVAGLVEKGNVRPLATERLFYEAIDVIKPGTDATLRIGGRDVALRVGQLIDETKPLLSLFVTRDQKIDNREWLGWSPVGPYESSAAKAERHLGWHVNTAEAAAPTRFSPAEEYRKKYYREGILRALVAAGDMSKVPPPPPPPAPKMGLLIEETGGFPPPDAQGQFLVRDPAVTLRLEVHGRPLDTLQGLAWQLDAAAEQPLEANADGEWSVPLKLTRGVHRVRFLARAAEGPAQEYAGEVRVRYQPPAPQLKYAAADRRPLVRQAAFDLRALVSPGSAGEAVNVLVRHRHKDETLVEETKTYQVDAAKPQEISRPLQLKPGYNRLEVIATNRAAPKEFEDLESDRVAVEVTYVEKSPPPRIELGTVIPLLSGVDKPKPLAVEPLKPLVVTVPRVRVVGSVEAKESLTKAEWASGAKAVPLARFEPGKQARADIAEELQLRPGEQTFRFLARTESSDEAERLLVVRYQPPAPLVIVQEPVADATVDGSKETGTARLVARLVYPGERHPFTARLIVNGKELPQAPTIDEQQRTLTASVPLRPRGNQIQVKVTNAWGGVSVTEPVTVTYARPPQVLKVENVTEGKRALVDLRVLVRTPLPLIPESVAVQVNGQERDVEAVFPDKPGADQTWDVRLKGVPLTAGADNEVKFWVSNTEARCRRPGEIQLQPPPAPKLEVGFLQPDKDGNVSQRDLPVRMRVRSGSPIKKVRLLVQNRPVATLDASAVKPDDQGVYEFKDDLNVRLSSGNNAMYVEAENAGERQISRNMTVNYLPRPAQFFVERLVPRVPGADPIPPFDTGGAEPAFPEVAAGRVRLEGRVRWGDEEVEGAKTKFEFVRVFVNGFQQLPAYLKHDPGNPREATFEAELLFNREKNIVALAVREQDAGQNLKFGVHCTKPILGQRMHLLTLSIREKEGDVLEEQLRRALEIRPGERGSLQAPAFEPVIPYGPLVGYYVRREYLTHQLQIITTRIKRQARAGDFGNDVVMLYYQGGEAVNGQGHFFQTSLSRQGSELRATAIDCQDLIKFFADTPGAHVLLLDVDRPGATPAPDRSKPTDVVREFEHRPEVRQHVVALRYAWLGQPGIPQDVQLITALGKTLPQVTTLEDMLKQAQQYAEVSRKTHPSLADQEYWPGELGDLLVRRTRGE